MATFLTKFNNSSSYFVARQKQEAKIEQSKNKEAKQAAGRNQSQAGMRRIKIDIHVHKLIQIYYRPSECCAVSGSRLKTMRLTFVIFFLPSLLFSFSRTRISYTLILTILILLVTQVNAEISISKKVS